MQGRLFMVISLTVIFCCACKSPAEKPGAINRTGVNLTEADINAEMMEIDKHPLWGYSAEGGEITRYRDSSGKVTRYRMIYYGETGRAEENYYYFGDDIYFTRLVENYRYPINVDIPTEVLNREFEQGVLMDGVCYQYDGEEGLSHSDTITIPYSSRKEIDDVFERAAAEEMTKRHFSDYRILAIDGFLLGGYYHGRWIEWEELYPMIPEEDIYKIYVNGQYKGAESGRKAPETNVELYSDGNHQ